MKIADKTLAKESKELQRRKRQFSKRPILHYSIIMLFVLAMCHIIDETSSQINTSLQSSIVTEFFVDGMGLSYNEGLSQLGFLNIITMLVVLITPIYKTLADKWGRKPLLVINISGFVLGMVLCFLSTNHITFIIGASVLAFFTSHDMQVTYILETAPNNRRAVYYGLTKGIGTLGVLLLPIVRNIFMGNDPTKWRMVYIVPGILGIIAVILIIAFARETNTFLEQRIKYLETPKAEIAKNEKKKNSEKTGIGIGFKYIFKHKQLRWMLFSTAFTMPLYIPMGTYYESILHTSGYSTAEITTALYMYPFVFGFMILICGFLADKIGRKKVVIGCFALSIVTLILFIVGCKNSWPPLAVGAFYALYISAFYQGGDYRSIMTNELSPTRIRFSIGGAMGLIALPLLLVGQIISSFAVAVFDVDNFVLAISIPCMLISAVLLALKVSETKNIDINNIEEIKF